MKQANESAYVQAEKKRLARRANCRREKSEKMRAYPPEFRLRAVTMCVEEGCVTCDPGDNSTDDQNSSIENLMNSYQEMKISIKEVCCSDDGIPKAERP